MTIFTNDNIDKKWRSEVRAHFAHKAALRKGRLLYAPMLLMGLNETSVSYAIKRVTCKQVTWP